ncbi:2-oxo-4-hydroxy-4-carboxy-5-ureidoimidazoline decarboxylase [Pseudokineococcus sp. 1T1Z-3]|uniref:2-oxo-4-hydroxy-4-carboxy-5-ureidoimidazoline decarboxylase n=1 Tax=Pseudokineococcus sp. 1T1Z-3 TaxID=3132745 RepID=UPI0030B6AD8A
MSGTGVDALREELLAACAVPSWADRVLARGPFGSREELRDVADAELAVASEAEVDEALAGHPRIGERHEGAGGATSRREQSAALDARDDVRAAIAEGNVAYEERFGHVYLVRAAGRSAQEMLDLLLERLRHEPADERRVVREQLREITALRLGAPAPDAKEAS